MRQFVLTIASRHPDLAYLHRDDRLLYVDTVLVILFYEFRYVFGVQGNTMCIAKQPNRAKK